MDQNQFLNSSQAYDTEFILGLSVSVDLIRYHYLIWYNYFDIDKEIFTDAHFIHIKVASEQHQWMKWGT